MCWHMPEIPTLGRQRQGDQYKFQATVHYIGISRLLDARAVSNNKNKKQKRNQQQQNQTKKDDFSWFHIWIDKDAINVDRLQWGW